MKELKCKACGAPLENLGFGKYICKYCGTLYKDLEGIITVIEVEHNPAVTIAAEYAVNYEMKEYIGEKIASEYALSRLKHELAEGLMSYMKLNVKEDPSRQAIIVRGEVRVIPPEIRH